MVDPKKPFKETERLWQCLLEQVGTGGTPRILGALFSPWSMKGQDPVSFPDLESLLIVPFLVGMKPPLIRDMSC